MPPNYDGDNMLIGANRLNEDIKRYLKSNNVYKHDLEEFKLDIEEYLRDIPPFEFKEREDDLTKDYVLDELRENLNQIEAKLQTMQGGRRKRRGTKHRNRKVQKRRNRTIRKRRNMKKRRN